MSKMPSTKLKTELKLKHNLKIRSGKHTHTSSNVKKFMARKNIFFGYRALTNQQ